MKGLVLLALLLLLTALTWRALLHTPQRMRTLLTWSGMLLVSCAIPVLAGVSTNTSESDRFLYMPSAFLCGLIAYALQCSPDRAWRWGATLGLLAASTFLILRNHADWRQASVITRRVIVELPEIPRKGMLYVTGLPDACQGAFIFRNGFPEAVWLAGGDGDRVVDVRPSAIGGDTAKGITVLHRGVLLAADPSDRWWHWNGEGYVPVSIPPGNADIR